MMFTKFLPIFLPVVNSAASEQQPSADLVKSRAYGGQCKMVKDNNGPWMDECGWNTFGDDVGKHYVWRMPNSNDKSQEGYSIVYILVHAETNAPGLQHVIGSTHEIYLLVQEKNKDMANTKVKFVLEVADCRITPFFNKEDKEKQDVLKTLSPEQMGNLETLLKFCKENPNIPPFDNGLQLTQAVIGLIGCNRVQIVLDASNPKEIAAWMDEFINKTCPENAEQDQTMATWLIVLICVLSVLVVIMVIVTVVILYIRRRNAKNLQFENDGRVYDNRDEDDLAEDRADVPIKAAGPQMQNSMHEQEALE